MTAGDGLQGVSFGVYQTGVKARAAQRVFGALALGSVLATLLFDVRPFERLTLAGVGALVPLLAVLGQLVPPVRWSCCGTSKPANTRTGRA